MTLKPSRFKVVLEGVPKRCFGGIKGAAKRCFGECIDGTAFRRTLPQHRHVAREPPHRAVYRVYFGVAKLPVYGVSVATPRVPLAAIACPKAYT